MGSQRQLRTPEQCSGLQSRMNTGVYGIISSPGPNSKRNYKFRSDGTSSLVVAIRDQVFGVGRIRALPAGRVLPITVSGLFLDVDIV
jgi:hypothetical protein